MFCQEVCHIFCVPANAVQAIVARTAQGAGILGVVDGSSPRDVENDADKAERVGMLKKFGYKLSQFQKLVIFEIGFAVSRISCDSKKCYGICAN